MNESHLCVGLSYGSVIVSFLIAAGWIRGQLFHQKKIKALHKASE